LTPDWPPGRSEADLLETVKRRAGVIRHQRRVRAAGATAGVAVVALVVSLAVGTQNSPRSLNRESAGSTNSIAAGRTSSGGAAASEPGSSANGNSTSGAAAPFASGGPQSGGEGSTSGSSIAATGGTSRGGSGGTGGSGSPGGPPVKPVPTPHPGSTAGFAPLPESVSPDAGPRSGGTTVVIHGIDLEDVRTVLFGAVPARSFEINTSTQITAVTPTAAQPGRVVISTFNASGNGGFDPLCVPDLLCPSSFTYTP
jgi:hypothetical protein